MAAEDFDAARARMVAEQLSKRGIRDPLVLGAMGAVPRERFVPAGMEEFAYADGPVPIPAGQTVSQPYVVASMIEAAGLQPNARALEIGAGSGYAAAVMSRIAEQVFAVERHPALAEAAADRLETLGFGNVSVQAGDGTEGWPDEAPFDAIVVSAGGPRVPQALKEQLALGGRLVIPVGPEEHRQTLKRVTRTAEGDWAEEDLFAVAFVPLIGKGGWPEAP